jgi:putative restriction endonuclease
MFPRDQVVKDELERRLNLWRELKARGGPDGISPQVIRQLGIHRGQQGVFREPKVTSLVSGNRAGVTVGVLHTGQTYADDLSEYGVTYHYPKTKRKGRDQPEIEGMKACAELGLPLFVVITPFENSPGRNVRLGWVQGHSDEIGQLYITFSDTEQPPLPLITGEDSTPFVLQAQRTFRQSKTKVRPNQGLFHLNALIRYGVGCAVCDIQQEALLDAAHICSVEHGGTDDPRNGLVFCLTHHRAFDKGFFGIDPETLRIEVRPPCQSPLELAITRESIGHLRKHPHREALEWAWLSRAPKKQKPKKQKR